MTIGCPLLFPRPLSGSAPLAIGTPAEFLKSQSSGFVPRRTLVSFFHQINIVPLFGGEIIDRP